MTKEMNFGLLQWLPEHIGRGLKTLWDFNEVHWLGVLGICVCWPVMINVTAALFPPIENSCWLNSSAIVPVAFSDEGDQP